MVKCRVMGMTRKNKAWARWRTNRSNSRLDTACDLHPEDYMSPTGLQ